MEMDYSMDPLLELLKLVILWNYKDSGKMIFIIFLPLFISQYGSIATLYLLIGGLMKNLLVIVWFLSFKYNHVIVKIKFQFWDYQKPSWCCCSSCVFQILIQFATSDTDWILRSLSSCKKEWINPGILNSFILDISRIFSK